VYADKIDNPVMEAMGRFAANGPSAAPLAGQLLRDSASGLVRAAGPGFSTTGMAATAERRLPGKTQVRVTYVSGSALRLATSSQAAAQAMGLAQLLASARARHAQSFSISLSGTLEGSGTHWRATYRWQPEDAVTPVAAFAENAAEPYLNLQLRQPIHMRRDGAGGFEALLNLHNLLAQGYQPYLMSDGSVLVFAQDQRGISGGLAFSF